MHLVPVPELIIVALIALVIVGPRTLWACGVTDFGAGKVHAHDTETEPTGGACFVGLARVKPRQHLPTLDL
jgi:hypothetical protein